MNHLDLRPRTDIGHAAAYVLVATIFSASNWLAPSASAQTAIPATANSELEQLPILYHHGFNDDGRLWARNGDGTGAGTAAEYWESLEIRRPNGTLASDGIPNYVVQYWAQSNAPGFQDGYAWATSDEGFAALKSPTQIRTPGANYNSPDPASYLLANAGRLFQVIPVCNLTTTGFICTIPAAEFLEEASAQFITTNYNRNGATEHHSTDFAELLRDLSSADSRFSGYDQVNIITHSAGGPDVRATLHRLNQTDDTHEKELVANVVYTAPPFGGSTLAVFAVIFYEDEVTADVFQNPWLLQGAGSLTLAELFRAVAFTAADENAADAVDQLVDYVPKAPGFDPTVVTISELASNPVLANLAVPFVYALRDLVTGFIGFPGEPKVSVDLTPWGAVENLNLYQPNPHVTQFVTWGEGGGGINLTPDVQEMKNAYSANGNCCDFFADPSSLTPKPGDWALSGASARMLTTPQGGMTELEGYPTLWHGTITTDLELVALDWVRVLVSPVTSAELNGPVLTADANARFYRVRPQSTITFLPENRNVTDLFNDQFTVTAQSVEYRIVSFDVAQEPNYGDWQTASGALSFDSFLQSNTALAGERPFRVEWRAVNQTGGREAIRSATFSIDATPPSLVSFAIVQPNDPNSNEIVGDKAPASRNKLLRSNFLTDRFELPNIQQLIRKPTPNWILRNPDNKELQIEVDEPGASIRWQWDAELTNPTTNNISGTSFALSLAGLAPGVHNFYFDIGVGTDRNATTSMKVVVDDQPPVLALSYESAHALGFVVGPDTPLQFVAQDAETNSVTGELNVPGFGSLDANESIRLGETTIAAAAEGTEITGLVLTLNASATDAVGNAVQEAFDVYYDFTPPQVTLQYVDGLLTSEGIYRTTDSSARIEIQLNDNAGFQLPTWVVGRPGNAEVVGGGAMARSSADGRPEAIAAEIPLDNGLNVVVITGSDLVGNTTTLTVMIEKAEVLIEEDTNRPLELLSRSVEGAPIGLNGPANVAVSDDGTVYAFDSSRRDHIANDVNDERDIFVWSNSTMIRANTTAGGAAATGGESRSPALSGNGRYVFFASEATNLVPETVTGLNLYVKDLNTGNIALVSRNKDGDPVNMNGTFGRFSFLRMSATTSGRYLYFADKYADYVGDDTNGSLDIFVADLDPDVDGDFFNTHAVIRRLNLSPTGEEAAGGNITTGGSRYPSVSGDGTVLVYQTFHTNLFENDANGTIDAVVEVFSDIDSNGTIDFSKYAIYPLGTLNGGSVLNLGSEHPSVSRDGTSAVFTTSQNISGSDTNQEGVDSDVYLASGFTSTSGPTALALVSTDGTGAAVSGRIAPNHAPTLSNPFGIDGPRTAYLADKAAVVAGDNNGQIDLFAESDQIEAINWLNDAIPSSQRIAEGGISANGAYAWWVTVEQYSELVVGAGTGLNLFRRRLDPLSEIEPAAIVRQPLDRLALVGETVVLNVEATGQPAPSFQWFKDGVELANATGSTLFFATVDFGDAGAYTVRVSNEAGEVTSSPALLVVESRDPVFVSQPSAVEVKEGESVTLTADVAGLEPLLYQWRRDGADLAPQDRYAGVRNDTLRIENAIPDDSGTYELVATNTESAATSESVVVTVTSTIATEGETGLPTAFALYGNYPNPFTGHTTIPFDLPEASSVRISVYNVLGQRVGVAADGDFAAGRHTASLDASGLASGVYIYAIEAGSYRESRRMMVVR